MWAGCQASEMWSYDQGGSGLRTLEPGKIKYILGRGGTFITSVDKWSVIMLRTNCKQYDERGRKGSQGSNLPFSALILPAYLFTRKPEYPFHFCYSEGSFNVLGHPEGDFLWHSQALPFFKANVVIDVHNFSCGHVDQHVIQMSVSETDDVANHWHHRSRSCVRLGRGNKNLNCK